ncbi:ATP-binding protein (plasmid) [Streptomyces zhihengii]|uniref:ATP-binding protein n=2 Tax=Streptomyces zhihengii TaxID=1818004 RepID=A0ABS2V4Z0_9ACTN|nr:ATP-binding protein [Streptomyces zhihengii]
MYVTAQDSAFSPTANAAGKIPAPRRPAEDDEVTQALECRPEAAGQARHTAEVACRAWHVDGEATDAVLLVVSELVTNAVEHAQPPVTLNLQHDLADGGVWVGVTDGGPAAHDGPWISSCSGDEHGRGMDIVDAIAETHGTHCHQGGTTHWAHLSAA